MGLFFSSSCLSFVICIVNVTNNQSTDQRNDGPTVPNLASPLGIPVSTRMEVYGDVPQRIVTPMDHYTPFTSARNPTTPSTMHD